MRAVALLTLALLACGPHDSPPGTLPRIDPEEAGFSAARLDELIEFLHDKVREEAFPGGVLVIGRWGAVAYMRAVGQYGTEDDRAVSDSTIYDLASLTKVVGLTTATMLLVSEEHLDLDRPVTDYLPEVAGEGKDRMLVRHLLTHTSGLDSWLPLYLETQDADEALKRVYETPLQSEPGTRYVYSDLGAILMTKIVERVAREPIDRFLAMRVFEPLRADNTLYRPPVELINRIAPTENDPWRGRVVHGEVHDENTAHLGGVSGHAGLFSTGPDMARFAIWLLNAWHGRLSPSSAPYVSEELAREFTRRQPGPQGSTRAIGWDTPTPGGGTSSGRLLDPLSFGHTGFTGTSIWIDPVREIFIILLTNRVHPTRENRALLPIRGEVADRVMEALEEGR